MNQVKVGRKPRPNKFIDINHNGKGYCVGIIESINGPIKFVFDLEDKPKVIQYNWFIISKHYVGTQLGSIDGKRQMLLLHNLVMNRLIHPGKGATETVDHLNRIPLDNRKENLCVKTQTEQNLNQKKKPRTTTELPEGCGIEPNDLPRHIWYIKPNGGHGDRFGIDCKSIGLTWKTTSSKQVSLAEKLRQAKEKLEEIYAEHPELNPDLQDVSMQPLITSFQEIIATIQ